MLLYLSRASFWLAALAAAWALIAPGRHETALTVVAGVAALLALALWRSALAASRRSYAGDADVPPPAVLSDAALADAAAAIARIAEESTSHEAALRAIAAVLKAELGARAVRLHDVLAIGERDARLAEWLPESRAPGSSGMALRGAARVVALTGSPLGAAVATRRDVVELPRTIAVPLVGAAVHGAAGLVLIELDTLEVAIAEPALASLLELTRLSHRALIRRLGTPAEPLDRGTSTVTVVTPGSRAPDADTTARVLGIEDKVIQPETCVPMLERLDCCATVASGMLEGMHAPRATQSDPVLMDTYMPDTGAADPFQPIRRPLPPQPQAMLDMHVRKRAPIRDLGDDAGSPQGSAGGADVLDSEALARLRELDPKGENQLVERVLKAFQTSVARLAPQLQTAREAGDRNTVRLVAHTLKSSSASIGAIRLSQLCAELEAAIRNDDNADIEPGVVALTAALDAAMQAIRRELDPAR
ncbi:MAG TPA: Hpt domain-containing protein [Burkholderiaceae bacterium]